MTNENRPTAHLLSGYAEEKRSAQLYEALSAQEGDHRMAYMLSSLGRAASDQADLWAAALRERGIEPPPALRLQLREKIAIWLSGHFGVRPVRGVLAALKIRGMSAYGAPHLHGHIAVSDIDQMQTATAGNGNLRAAVFGVNDGLVSNTSLILGMVGAAADSRTVLMAGVAGMLAGAMSMAAGEYISVRSQREVYEYQIDLERAELEEYPDAERQELTVIYEAKGLPPEDADRIARTLIANPELALDTMAREELGLNPNELGSPRGAALYSFASFSTGALIPVLPFWILPGNLAVGVAIGFACTSLFIVGSTLSLFTGRGALPGGLRMLSIGIGAGLITYLIGAALNLTAII